ncbi:hypothetical protein [Deinococcus multiflagellatus]|uniref:Uncharacterized protein n=1 Tax=Deinococcus multiflagellatus TaxID=1656887 RepID=A0ABW1ZQ74_9DEIO|nr:hypothetical protein [Deinococcus multiflagellatus]MBZ9714940.1 hypothetical protein [Deinococcus multiflagellatus]
MTNHLRHLTPLLLLGALTFSSASAQTTPSNPTAASTTRAGTEITNTGYLDYLTDEGTNATDTSNTVTATVKHVPAVSVTPDGTPGAPSGGAPVCGQTVIGVPGTNAVLTYQIQNTSNGPDVYSLTTSVNNGPPQQNTAVTYYLDDGDGTFDPAVDQSVTTVSLDVGETRTLFATFPIGQDEAGTTQFQISPVATSEANKTVADTANLGCIDTQDRVGAELMDDNFRLTTAPATVITEHTLRNTGNVTLTADSLQLDQQGGNYPTTYRLGTQSTEYASPQQALTAFGGLTAGQSVQLHVTQSVPAGEANATVSTLRLYAYTPQIGSPERLILTPYDAARFRTDELYIGRGIGRLDKTQALCSLDGAGTLNCPAAQTMFDAIELYKQPIEVQPCSVVKYVLFARNDGDALLRQGRLRDTIPANTTLLDTVPLFNSPAALYRVNGGTWTNTAPTNLPEGTSIEVGPDLNGDGQFTADDGLPARSRAIGAALYVQVKGPNCAVPTAFPAETYLPFQPTSVATQTN